MGRRAENCRLLRPLAPLLCQISERFKSGAWVHSCTIDTPFQRRIRPRSLMSSFEMVSQSLLIRTVFLIRSSPLIPHTPRWHPRRHQGVTNKQQTELPIPPTEASIPWVYSALYQIEAYPPLRELPAALPFSVVPRYSHVLAWYDDSDPSRACIRRSHGRPHRQQVSSIGSAATPGGPDPPMKRPVSEQGTTSGVERSLGHCGQLPAASPWG